MSGRSRTEISSWANSVPPAADAPEVRAVGRPVPAPHVYAHVPFCVRKCPYCDFNSHAGRDAEMSAYVSALLEEARRRLDGRSARTIYVGGGTPTHLDLPNLERLMEGLAAFATGVEEWTVEANPGSVDRAKLDVLAGCGVTRVSLGAQSFDARHLRALGRIHDADAIRRSAALVREAGIPDLSVDLILAPPGQTLAEQELDLAEAVSLDPDHVSAYVLTYEPGTVFTARLRAGRMKAPDPDRELGHLARAVSFLESAGYARYEVSNFARAGRVSRHNLGYWHDADWIALGAGAHAHVSPRRWKNVDDPAEYVGKIASIGHAVEWAEWVSRAMRLFESLMMGLRLTEGIDASAVTARVGLDPRLVYEREIAEHVAGGLLAWTGSRLHATPRGLDLLARILEDFVPEAETVETTYT